MNPTRPTKKVSPSMIPQLEWLLNPELDKIARTQLPCKGLLLQNFQNRYVYLKVSDDFIHKLFPLLQENDKQIPSYFSSSDHIGAHISVIYPEESYPVPILPEINNNYGFEIGSLFKAQLGEKTYLGLTVKSPELDQLRLRYGLSTQLNFRGYLVPFHITIATV
jgi:hypothetical protein